VVVAEKLGAFDEVVVWGHGSAVDEKEDAYVRGIREWIGFAEAMHNEDDEEDGKDKKRSE
jgi:ribonuclease H2 subunit C